MLKRIPKWIPIIFLFAISGCAATGQAPVAEKDADSAGAAEEQVADAGNDSENEVVCRREKKVGSNMYQRVCKTRRQIEEERADAEEAMRLQQQRNARGTISNSRNSGG